MKDLESAKIKEMLRGIKIPPQPQIMVDIQMELAMPGSGAADIARLISRDVGLSGNILKVVNSSFFGLKNKIVSVSQAISLLGIPSVVNIINSVTLQEELNDETIVALTGFWDNAVDIAATCAYISKAISFSAPDEAYTLGLFHNSGIPLLMMRFDEYPGLLKQSYASTDKRITQVESDALSTNHAIIGHYVAKSWKLPDPICAAITEHHDCLTLFSENGEVESTKRNLLAILKLSEHLCQAYRVIGGGKEDYEFESLKEPLLYYLGISEIDVENLRDELVDQGIIA